MKNNEDLQTKTTPQAYDGTFKGIVTDNSS